MDSFETLPAILIGLMLALVIVTTVVIPVMTKTMTCKREANVCQKEHTYIIMVGSVAVPTSSFIDVSCEEDWDRIIKKCVEYYD